MNDFVKFGEYLNDIIIDFYLMHLLYTLPENLRGEIQIFPTTFYKRLCDVEQTTRGGVNTTGLTNAEKMHLGVKKWTKNIDIFKKKLLLIPVCQSAHWFMIVVLLPELLLIRKNPQLETALVILNSLDGDCEDAVQNISFYLQEELVDKKGVKIKNKDFHVVYPPCPKQADGFSCGIFLLHYSEMILSRLKSVLVVPYKSCIAWAELGNNNSC